MTRPSFFLHHTDKPRKFTQEFKDDDGTSSIWIYDLDIFEFGPISCEITYPKNFDHRTEDEKLAVKQKGLNKTEQQYFNPANGKLVGYGRAKQLGLVK